MNHYPRHIGDWMRDTAHLSEVEECVYSRMLDQYYSREKALPADSAAVCRLVRATSKVACKAVDTVLSEFFTLESDGWHQKRCDAELEAYREKVSKASASAKARWAHTERNANALPTQSEGNANHKPITNNQEPIKSSRARGARLAPDWVLPKPWGEWALQEQKSWDSDYCRKVGEKFKDHWLSAAGARGVKMDWEATWRNWVRNEGPMRADQKPKLTLAELMEREERDAA